MSDLPDSWAAIKLGDIIDYGNTTKAEPSDIPDEAWVLELEDIEKDTSRICQHLSFAERKSKSTKNAFQKGDVLYGKLRPYLNKVVIAPESGFCSTEIVPLKTGSSVDARYLLYWLRHPIFLAYVQSVSHGINMPRLGTEAGKNAPLILAPFNEQKRIADRLDVLLGRVDACRRHLERIPQILKRFRQSVLDAAVTGELSQEWRTQNGCPLDWLRCSLGELIQRGPQNGLYKPSSAYGEGARILRIDSFYDGEVLSWESLKRLGLSPEEQELYGLAINDIVINRVNSPEYVGKSALIRNLPETCVFESNMMRLAVDTSRLLPEYAVYYLNAPRGLSELRKNVKHAVNQSSINQTDIRSVEIAVPGLTEQREIVRRVKSMLSAAERIQKHYDFAAKELERVIPSVLAKAFCGELVSHDSNDEPAAELLRKVQQAAGRVITKSKVPRKEKALVK